jgi:hypothetical protein
MDNGHQLAPANSVARTFRTGLFLPTSLLVTTTLAASVLTNGYATCSMESYV